MPNMEWGVCDFADASINLEVQSWTCSHGSWVSPRLRSGNRDRGTDPLLTLLPSSFVLRDVLILLITSMSSLHICIHGLLYQAMLASISLHGPTQNQPLWMSGADMLLPDLLLKGRNMLCRFAFDTDPNPHQIAKIRGVKMF